MEAEGVVAGADDVAEAAGAACVGVLVVVRGVAVAGAVAEGVVVVEGVVTRGAVVTGAGVVRGAMARLRTVPRRMAASAISADTIVPATRAIRNTLHIFFI